MATRVYLRTVTSELTSDLTLDQLYALWQVNHRDHAIISFKLRSGSEAVYIRAEFIDEDRTFGDLHQTPFGPIPDLSHLDTEPPPPPSNA